MKLHELKPAEGSRKVRNRVGRGIGSGNGKTAGKVIRTKRTFWRRCSSWLRRWSNSIIPSFTKTRLHKH